MTDTKKSSRGFGAMHPDKQREIARKGGRAAHAAGTAHTFDSAEAKAAGAKGGKAHSPEYLRELGRRGGAKRAENRRAAATLAEAFDALKSNT